MKFIVFFSSRINSMSPLLLHNFFLIIIFLVYGSNTLNGQDKASAIRVIMIGAHPDDCDQEGGGTAIYLHLWGMPLNLFL